MSYLDPTPQELRDHIANNYGTCLQSPCTCLASGQWFGVICPHWSPVKAKDYQELAIEMRNP